MKNLAWVFIALISFGCTPRIVKHEYVKNYVIGEPSTAYIGEPVLKVNDYLRTIYDNNDDDCYYFKPTNDFTLNGEYSLQFANKPFVINGLSKDKYMQSDRIKHDDNIYYLVEMIDDGGKTIGLMIDNNGNISSKSAYIENVGNADLKNPTLTPSGTRMMPTKQKTTCKKKQIPDSYTMGQNNFELIYGGINNVTVSMTYREYTPDAYARPAFSQNLIYETSAKEIRFKSFRIGIIEITNEKVVYKVIEDKLENSIVNTGGQL